MALRWRKSRRGNGTSEKNPAGIKLIFGALEFGVGVCLGLEGSRPSQLSDLRANRHFILLIRRLLPISHIRVLPKFLRNELSIFQLWRKNNNQHNGDKYTD
jgi:hypothetical protein